MAGTAVNIAELIERLAGRGETLAVAESLTGGLLSAAIVSIPGASAVFRGGLVVYATDLKHKLGGVPEPMLTAHGPVDPEVAAALAAGARRAGEADWGLAATGVAGPQPQGGVAVGTVYVAVAGPGNTGEVREVHLDGDRSTVRAGAVNAALELLAGTVGGVGAPIAGAGTR